MILNRFTGMLISFFLFPFIVKNCGKELYGVYLLVTTVTGYFGLLDFGVMSALTKYVSEYNGKGDKGAMNRVINASLTFYVLVGIVSACLLFGLAFLFYHFFKIDATHLKDAKQLFLIAGASALLTWPLSTFKGTIEGINLWSVEAVVNIIIQISNLFFALLIFKTGHGIVLYFMVTQSLNILGSVTYLTISKRKSNFSITFPFFDVKTFKFIFKFSVFMFLASLASVFLFQIHNLIIGYFLSISAITIYAVSYNIQNYFRTINSALGGPPWTIASEMEGRRDYEGQKQLLFKGTRYISMVFLPVIIIVFVFAKPFIANWMGPGFEESVMPARIIILYWLFNGTLEVGNGMLSAKGEVKKPLFVQLGIAIINIIIALSLIKVLGITALALGLTVSMAFVGAPLYLRLSLKLLNVSFHEYFNKAIRRNLILYVVIGAISFFVYKLLYPQNIYLTLLEMGLIYSLSLILFYFTVFKTEEKMEIWKIIGMKRPKFI
jgi:O-antigen/teichoic acid export membrane protein